MATLEETLDKAIEVAVKRAILKAHPVGSLYLSLSDENPSISLGGVHGSRLARGNACGERTVAMQWEQKLAQGYRTSRAKFKVQVGTAVLCVLTQHFQALCREHSKATRHGMARTKAHTTLRSTQANRTQSTAIHPRYNLPLWRSTFGGGQRNGYI